MFTHSKIRFGLAGVLFGLLTACSAAPATPLPTLTMPPVTAALAGHTATPDAQGALWRIDPELYTYWISGPEILELASGVHATELATGAQAQLFQAPAATSSMDIRNVSAAVFAPDGKQVLLSFANYGDSGGSLRLVSADGKQVTPFLGQDKATFEFPLWSPDGKQLAMRAARSPYCLTITNADGTASRTLTCNALAYPRYWSSDGKWILVMQLSTPPQTEKNWVAVSVQDAQVVPLAQLPDVKWYDQRYYPWRVVSQPKYNPPADPRSAWLFSFWRAE